MRILIKRGDITAEAADALVNAANNMGYMGGGVAGAIKRAGGHEIEDEALAQGPVPVGEAWVTGAGRLGARFVIHAATMGMDFRTDEPKIRSATRSAMKRACELGVDSVAFPALGTGVGGFPPAEAARIMHEEIWAFRNHPRAPGEVRIVLWDEETYEVFKRALARAEGVEVAG